MDDRRARNHARDRRLVLAAMPSLASWQPARTTAQIVADVNLPERTVLRLLDGLRADGRAVEAGGLWRRRAPVPPARGYPPT